MSDNVVSLPANRSVPSLHFEKGVRAAGRRGALPRLADIDFAELHALVPWIAIIDPDNEAHTLRFSLAGAGLSAFLGRDLAGFDYLEIVDPAIKGEAYDSAFLMLSRPCGLWQITPVVTADGDIFFFEYTGFPVFDHAKGSGQIIFLIHHPYTENAGAENADAPRIASVRHATEWHWLEMREPSGA